MIWRIIILILALAVPAEAQRERFSITVSTPTSAPAAFEFGEQLEPHRLKGELAYAVFGAGCKTAEQREAALRGVQTKPGKGNFCKVVATGTRTNYIPDAGLAHLVSVLRGQATFARFHGLGQSSQVQQATDTGCVQELTTQYANPGDNTRATGTQEVGDGPNIFKTTGINAVDGGATLREFCLMSAASGGAIWSRILIGQDVPVTAGQTVTTTYLLTLTR